MRRPSTILVLTLFALALGCVSKSRHEALQQQLASCETEKGKLQDTTADYVRQLDGERRRWDQIQSQMDRVIPDTLRSFEEERAKIVALVPEQVQKQVGKRLDSYFVTVNRHFEDMGGQIQQLQSDLARANATLAELQSQTKVVDTHVQESRDVSGRQVEAARAQLEQHRRDVSKVAAEILAFDTKHVNCDRCDAEGKIKGKGRELLAAFHADVVKALTSLGSQAGT